MKKKEKRKKKLILERNIAGLGWLNGGINSFT